MPRPYNNTTENGQIRPNGVKMTFIMILLASMASATETYNTAAAAMEDGVQREDISELAALENENCIKNAGLNVTPRDLLTAYGVVTGNIPVDSVIMNGRRGNMRGGRGGNVRGSARGSNKYGSGSNYSFGNGGQSGSHMSVGKGCAAERLRGVVDNVDAVEDRQYRTLEQRGIRKENATLRKENAAYKAAEQARVDEERHRQTEYLIEDTHARRTADLTTNAQKAAANERMDALVYQERIFHSEQTKAETKAMAYEEAHGQATEEVAGELTELRVDGALLEVQNEALCEQLKAASIEPAAGLCDGTDE